MLLHACPEEPRCCTRSATPSFAGGPEWSRGMPWRCRSQARHSELPRRKPAPEKHTCPLPEPGVKAKKTTRRKVGQQQWSEQWSNSTAVGSFRVYSIPGGRDLKVCVLIRSQTIEINSERGERIHSDSGRDFKSILYPCTALCYSPPLTSRRTCLFSLSPGTCS